MKEYFLTMFAYDFYANKIILGVIRNAKEVAKPVELMNHIFSVNQIWFDRCKGQPSSPVPSAEGKGDSRDGSVDKADTRDGLDGLAIQSNEMWIGFINGLSEADFEKPVKYQNSKGVAFENQLSDILTQVTNHGTHHRAQIGQHLKFGGIEALPNTDYINFIRLSR
jgi:uncharacterized damage-inducible protein DinB